MLEFEDTAITMQAIQEMMQQMFQTHVQPLIDRVAALKAKSNNRSVLVSSSVVPRPASVSPPVAPVAVGLRGCSDQVHSDRNHQVRPDHSHQARPCGCCPCDCCLRRCYDQGAPRSHSSSPPRPQSSSSLRPRHIFGGGR
jgi:hypothetical protein